MANVERLEQLKRVVREAPEELFDMDHVDHQTDCGTAHCAWGWAKVDPWFNSEIPGIKNKFLWRAHEVFDISPFDSNRLFDPNESDRRIAKQEVIANIDRIIRGEPAIPYPD